MGTVVQRRLAYTAATATSAIVVLSVANHEVNRQRPLPLIGHTSASLLGALPSLKSAGVGIVHNILDKSLLNQIQATEVFQTMPTSIRRPPIRRRRGPPGAPRGVDEEVDLWPPSASGRYHRREDSFNEEDMKVFEKLENKILPLVVEFFDAEAEDGQDLDGFFRSEMQVCVCV